MKKRKTNIYEFVDNCEQCADKNNQNGSKRKTTDCKRTQLEELARRWWRDDGAGRKEKVGSRCEESEK
jgi:hypothetical protein